MDGEDLIGVYIEELDRIYRFICNPTKKESKDQGSRNSNNRKFAC